MTTVYVVVWIVTSLLGLILSAALLNQSRLDLRALGEMANGRRLVVQSRGLREAARFTVHGAYIVAGLSALGILPFTDWIVPILIYGNLAMVGNSLVDLRTRHLVYATRDAEPPIPGE